MPNILTLRDIDLSFGDNILLDKAHLVISQRKIISLIGRNGEGKSTLLKLINKEISADGGEYNLTNAQTIAHLPQTVPQNITGDVFSVIASGLSDISSDIINYHNAVNRVSADPSDKNLASMAVYQQKMENNDGWSFQQQVDTILSKLNLTANVAFSKLSGGVKRRVLLGRALVKNPNLLLLDEPTNHLDITNILWLENLIKSLNCTVLLITHDRQFMQNVSNKILELDRGKLTIWDGDYQNYLRRKDERDNAEAKENARFDKKLSREEIWIRQGIKARRTRNEGRVRKLQEMRALLKQRRTVKGVANLKLQQFENSSKLVIKARNINYQWADDEIPIIHNLDLTIARGDKIGIIGANGCGKSTLLNILLKKIEPNTGTVKLGNNLQIAYFDQLGDSLKLKDNLQDNINDGSDYVTINGKAVHIHSYLQDFLFSPKQIRQPVKSLSGGERNRLVLAKLFAHPANLVVLDEPTNDLDIETLDLLEELLINYQGTVILVSHDRSFLDNVVTASVIFESDKKIYQSIGGYSDWMAIRGNFFKETITQKSKKTKVTQTPVKSTNIKELNKVTKTIEKLECKIATLQNQLTDSDLYQNQPDEFQDLAQKLKSLELSLEEQYQQWQTLEHDD